MKANSGDQIIVGVTTPDTPARRGQVVEVLGHDPDVHYLVRWQDGHESVYVPSSDSQVLNVRRADASSSTVNGKVELC